MRGNGASQRHHGVGALGATTRKQEGAVTAMEAGGKEGDK
jgi:hypothetical protein